MLNLRKDVEPTWTEAFIRKSRTIVKQLREGGELSGDLIATGKHDPVQALRLAFAVYSNMSMVADYCQKAMLTLNGGSMATLNEVSGPYGDVYQLGLTLNQVSVLTSPHALANAGKSSELIKGDDFATMIQHEHLSGVLRSIADDNRSMFRIVAHHPDLMRRMSAVLGQKGPIQRTFTLSLDNNLAVSGNRIYFRRQWDTLRPSMLSQKFVIDKAANVSNMARLMSERMVEHACYTDDPRKNMAAVLFFEADQVRQRAETLLKGAARAFQKRMAMKYKGFSSFGSMVEQGEAIAVNLGTGLVALSGAPIVSVKSAVNADMPIIKAIAVTHLGSVEVQQLRFAGTANTKPSGEAFIHWPDCQEFARKSLDPFFIKTQKDALAANKYLKNQKV